MESVSAVDCCDAGRPLVPLARQVDGDRYTLPVTLSMSPVGLVQVDSGGWVRGSEGQVKGKRRGPSEGDG